MGSRYWVISDENLRRFIERAHEGETPGVLLAEIYANSDHEEVDGGDADVAP